MSVPVIGCSLAALWHLLPHNEEGLIGHATAWPINPVELNRWVEGNALGDSMSGR
jgi:hypothetical protein